MFLIARAKNFATQSRYIHLGIALALLLIFAGVFAINAQRSSRADREELQHDLITAQTEVRMRLDDTIEYLTLLGSELAQEQAGSAANFQTRAQAFAQHHPELGALGWHRDGEELFWSSPLLIAPHLSLSLKRPEVARALRQAQASNAAAMSEIFRTPEGKKVFAIFVPSIRKDTLFCFISLDELIQSVLPAWINNRYDITVLDEQRQTLFREPLPSRVNPDLSALSQPLSPLLPLYLRLQRYDEGHDWQTILLMALSLGVVIGVALAVQELNADRRQKRELAIQMSRAKELAETANRTKSEFVANVSHELRTPLTAIVGFSDLLVRDLPHPPQLESRLQTITQNAQHLLLLINDLLDHSKIEAGFLEINKAPLHLPDFLTELLVNCSSLAQAKQLKLTVGTLGPVPLNVKTDGLRLKQILTNLIGNAIKFTEAGEVEIRLKVLNDEQQLEFRVKDTGIGIGSENREKIFGAFAQAEPQIAQRFGGSGLGLSLSRHLAERLGGEVLLLASEPQRGSTFACRIPLELESAHGNETFEIQSLEAPPQIATPQNDLLANLDHRRILLVEDSQDNQLLICAYLERTGAQVVCADNAESALKRFASGERFDAILMDIQLPGMDGYAGSRALRAAGYTNAIIALTAQTASGEEERCYAAGCQAYLAKPFNPHHLIETLRTFSAPLARSAGPSPILSKLSDDASLKTIVAGFVTRLPDRLHAIESACAQADWPKLARIAHTLKGTAANFGYQALASEAARLEELSIEPNPRDAVHHSLLALKSLVEQMHRGIRKEDS